MLSALLPSYSSEIPLRAMRTLTGRENNRPSLCATPPCATSFLAGRHPYQPTFCRVSQRPSFSEIQELVGKGRLHTTDDRIVLLVRQSTPKTPSDSQHPMGRAACLLND